MKKKKSVGPVSFLRRALHPFVLLLILGITGLIFPARVRADVIFEPDNSFYLNHSGECTYLNRSCIAGEDALLWDAPNTYFLQETAAEGEPVYISYVYTDADGLEWGLAENRDKWMLMADLLLPYSSQEFARDHAEEIFDGEPCLLEEGTDYVRWSYPESGDVIGETGTLMGDVTISTFYEDSAGRLWGYREYMFGSRNIWLCLSDLTSTQIPQFEEHDPVPAQEADAGQISSVKEQGRVNIWFLVIPVIAIAILSGLLIWRFWLYRGRKQTEP